MRHLAKPLPPRRGRPRGRLSHDHAYLISYDIADPARLRRVAERCLDHGVRVQKSVFECRLRPDAFRRLRGELLALVDPREDSVLFYKIDPADTVGGPARTFIG